MSHQLGEVESTLEEIVMPSAKNVDLKFEEQTGNLLVTQIQANIKEGHIKPAEGLQVEDKQVELEFEQLKPLEEMLEVKALVSETQPHSVAIEETKPEQKEIKKKKSIKKKLAVEKPTEQTAEEPKVISKEPKQEETKEVLEEKVESTESTPQKVKLKPMKVERKEIKPSTVQFAQEKVEVPLFATIKLRKSSVAPKKEVEIAQLPKFLLKSRITKVEYPPSIKYLKITELVPPVVDSGILSRNYEEAQKIKKKKIKKIKLPEIEKTELEQYVPFEDIIDKKEPEQKKPVKMEKIVVEKPKELIAEPTKLKIGKGKLPQEENIEEVIKLKTIPKKVEKLPEETEEKPKAPELEKPIVKPDEPSEEIKLKLPKSIDTGETNELSVDQQPTKQEEVKPEEKIEKKKKTKIKPVKPDELPEETKIVLGKPKKTSPEPPETITLKKKQGILPSEEPETIKLKPFDKEKSVPEPELKEIEGVRPTPYDIKREEEEIQPKEFDIGDKKPKKKKKKVSKEDELEEEIPAKTSEEPQQEDKKPEKIEEKLPKMKPELMEKVEVKAVQPKKVETQEIKPGEPFTMKLKKAKIPEKKEEKAKEPQRILLKSRIKRITYPPQEHKCTYTELITPVVDNGILSRNYEEAKQIIKKKPTKVKLPRKPKRELEEVEKMPEEDKIKEEKQPEIIEKLIKPKQKEEEPEEVSQKLLIGKGKLPDVDKVDETIKLKKIPLKPEEPIETEEIKKKPKEKDDKKEKSDKEYSDTSLEPVEVIEFPERPSDEIETTSKNEDIEKIEPEEKLKKRPKSKPLKPEEPAPEKKLILGKGKKKESPPPEEIKFRIPKAEKPSEEPEEIQLKPFLKERPSDEEDNKDLTFEGKILEEKPEEEVSKEMPDKKKKAKKKKPTTEEGIKKQEELPTEPCEEEPIIPEPEVTEIKKEKQKLIPQKIERKEIKPTKLQMNEPEQPLFSTVKLRKSSIATKPQESKTQEVKRFLLKSRITKVKYPPDELKPIITILPKVILDNGILSRNYKEAVKIIKVKQKKVKLPEKEETVLEKYEPYMEEKEEPEEEIQQKAVSPRERPGKKLPEEEVPKKLEIGKGKLKEEEESPERIKLKKVPERVEEEEKPILIKKPSTTDEEITKPKIKAEEPEDKIDFIPSIKDEKLEKPERKKSPSPEPVEEEKKEEIKPTTKKVKKIKKDEPIEEKKLILGEPKPQPEEETKEITLKKPKPKEPDEQPEEEIKLKPLKKEKETEKKTVDEEVKLSLEKPIQKVIEEEEQQQVIIKKRKSKPEKEETVQEEIIIRRPSKVPIEEEPAAETIISLKKKPEVKTLEEIDTEVTLKKIDTTYVEEEASDSITIKKKPRKKSEIVEEETTQVTLKKQKEKISEEVASDVVVVKRKSLPKSIPEDEALIKITFTEKPKPAEEESTEIVTLKKTVPQIQPEEITEEFTVKKELPEEIVQEEFTLKKTLKKPVKPSESEDVSEEITIKKIKPKPTISETVGEEVTIRKTPAKKKYSVSEESGELTIQKTEEVEEEVPKEEEAVAVSFKKPKKPKEEEVEIKLVKKPVRKQSTEEISEAVTLLKPRKKSEPQIEEVVESVTFVPKKVKQKEEVEQEFKIRMGTYEEEEVEMSGKVKLPSRKKRSFAEEASSETIYLQQEIEEEVPYVVEEVEEQQAQFGLKKPKTFKKEEVEKEFKISSGKYEEEEVEMTTKIKLPSKKKPVSITEEESAETVHVKREIEKEVPYTVEEMEEEHVKIGLKRPKVTKKEEVEQEFKISMGKYEEEEIEMTGKVKLPRKKKPVTFAEEESSETIIIRQEVEEEGPEHVKFPLRRKSSTSQYSVQEVEEEIQLGLRKPRSASVVYEEESLELKIKRKPSKPLITSFHQEEASLHITKLAEETTEEGETRDGTVLFSICSYLAETEDALNLVEGEKVYILESNNPDWWFVRKHLTEEKGWVPAVYLRDEPSYTLYVQKKLHEKIDKLPIFEKPAPGANVFAPKFVEKLQPKWAPDGATVQFECKVEGNPRPQITWFRQTAIIKPSPEFQIFYDEDNVATLIINEVFPEDAGTFTCVAKNAAGFASSTTTLVIETPLSDHGSDTTGVSRRSLSRESSLADILEGIPPTFSRKPKSQVVNEGTNIQLEVRLVAVPEPEITWLHNDKPIDGAILQSDMHMYSSVLTIKKIKKKQEGTYTVIATNREGEASLKIQMKVKTGEPEAPVFLEPLKDFAVTEGEGVLLSVQVSGVPTPKVKWLKDGKPTTVPTTEKGETHSLPLGNVKPSDAGQYTVEASNPHGKVTTTSNLTVQEIRKQYAPLFVERFEELNVREKGTVKLTAKVKGNPIPTVTWFRNNKTLLASPRITEMFDGEQILLEITDIDSEQDSGNYKCVATNPLGSATHGARIIVDVPQVSFTKLLPPRVEMDEMTTMTLECETSHTVSSTWYHDGKELSGMDNREIIQQGRYQRLVIKKANRKDKGIYKCCVKDQSTETKLIVHEVKPDFVRKLEDCEIKEQQCVVLEVEISSNTADVVWQKDGFPLEQSPGKIEMEKQGSIRKLFIRSTSVHDEGEYTCVLGDQECTAEVTIIELPPEILTQLQDTSIPRGEKACLEVELTKGDALVRWYKDDVELQFSEHVQLSIDGKRQKLKIYQAEESDAGIYSCRVGDQVSSAKLTVEEPQVEFITRLPDVTMLPIGSDAEFTVELSRPDVEVKWLKKGKEIKSSDRFLITSDGTKRKLVIKKVTLDDQTDISCMAMNVKTTSKLKIEVIETAPRINVDVREYKVKKGEDATFTIKYTGTPKPKDEWTVNGTVIKESKRIITKVEEDSASLTIKKVDDSDRGTYCIKLKNNVGEASASLTLIIIEVPDAPGVPEIVDISNTSVTVHWKEPAYDGNTAITSYILEHHDKEEFLKWHEITDIVEKTYKVTGLTRGHEITFRVSAVNEVGRGKTSDSSKYVKIEEPGSSQAPSFKEPLSDISAGLDRSVTLACVVAGTPTPEVKWFKDSKVLKTKNASYINNVSKLIIERVIESSGGVYTCKASNSAGTAETTCKLIVQEAPALKIDDETSSLRLKIKEQWKPIVEFTGFPKPVITWSKDGKEIISDKKVSVYTDEKTTTLAIYSVDRKDSGTYTVDAVNTAGKATLDISLKIIDKPSKPKALDIKDIEAESVNVSWEPPADDGGVDISKYSLEKCEVGKFVWTKVADIERDVRSYTVQRLLTNAEYMFRIFAQNTVGISEPVESDPVIVKSIYGKPSAPSGPIQISGMTESSCTISWEVPMSDGGTPIIDYNVETREAGQTFWTKVGTTKDLQIIVEDMKKEKTYEFRVSARNRVGSGPYLISDEPVVAGRKKTPPSPPKNISVSNIASKSVTLQWEPPVSNGGSELTGYVIEKQPSATSKWTKVVTLDPNITHYCVENLKEKSEFYFRVFAENIIGLSFPTTTNLVSLKTHATVPSPPTAPLEVRSTGANSVMLAWGVPESDGGAPIEGYKIAVRDIKKTMWMEVGRVSADVQKLTVKDLQENHEYLIRIFARNEVGMSNPLESDDAFKVQRPTAGGEDIDIEEMGIDKDTPSLSFTTTTTQSWMREAGMDPDIRSYARSSLLRRSEYFFRIWYYAKHLFK